MPDRTKLECIEQKKAVDDHELRQRHAKGETGLLIRDGVVLKRQLCLSPSSTSQNSNQSSASLTSQNSNQSS